MHLQPSGPLLRRMKCRELVGFRLASPCWPDESFLLWQHLEGHLDFTLGTPKDGAGTAVSDSRARSFQDHFPTSTKEKRFGYSPQKLAREVLFTKHIPQPLPTNATCYHRRPDKATIQLH